MLVDPWAFADVGFRLSFAAVAAILLATAAVLKPYPSPPSVWQRVRDSLLTYVTASAAAYLGTLPILAQAFHTVPTFGIPANLLLLPLAALLVPGGHADPRPAGAVAGRGVPSPSASLPTRSRGSSA